jgi:hypothetical protein
VLNQYCGHWLFSNALNATITMNLKLKEEYGISSNLEDFTDDDFVVALELSFLHSMLGKKYVGF